MNNEDQVIRKWLHDMQEKYKMPKGGEMCYQMYPYDIPQESTTIAYKVSSRGKGTCTRVEAPSTKPINGPCDDCPDCAYIKAQDRRYCIKTQMVMRNGELKPKWCPKK